MIDTDNSGQITFEELKVGLKRFGANLQESEIYDLMQAVRLVSHLNVLFLHVTLLRRVDLILSKVFPDCSDITGGCR